MPTKTSTISKKTITKIATTKPVVKKIVKPVVKPVVKKVATKKVATKTKKATAKKAVTGKALVYADNDHSFWVKNGEVLNSLTALYQALASMDDAVFAHHVTKDKHDFSDWVDSVLDDKVCAKDLRKAKNQDKACAVIALHLKKYRI